MKKIKLLIKKILYKLNETNEKTLVLQANLLIERNRSKKISSINEVEFQVYSQNGEDGIIQYLIQNIEIPNKEFIEFGVETYLESNTRFLLMNNNWSGFIIEGDKDFSNFILSSPIYQKYDLVLKNSFITKQNINSIIKKFNTQKDIGLLSIDIDGNDYWIWEAIEAVSPRIVICEYNATFGNTKKVSLPYDANFNKDKNYTNLYFGASIQALIDLGNKKGYEFIGCNETGANAFFVRKDTIKSEFLSDLKKDFKDLKARSSKDKNGKLTFKRPFERLELIKNEVVFDFETNSNRTIKEVFGLD